MAATTALNKSTSALSYKVTRTGSPTEYRHYIRGGNGTAAIHIRRSNGTSDTYYLHQDHLGSPELITGTGGAVVVRASFSAYGERRDDDHDGAIPAGELSLLAGVTRRGFTGHEHLDGVGLIHMNGRVYDPRIGRFLGADPIVVAGHSQGANPYGYVWNNPLRYTDPSGFCTDAVACYESGFSLTIGGSLWNLVLNRNGLQEPRVPSATPPSAPYESPGMVLPREGRATFGPQHNGVPPIVVSTSGIRIRYGAYGRTHETILGQLQILSLEANQSDALESGLGGFHANSEPVREAWERFLEWWLTPRQIPWCSYSCAKVDGNITQIGSTNGGEVLNAIGALPAGSLFKIGSVTAPAVRATSYASKQLAREALDGPLGSAANRFFRDAGKNARDFRISEIAGGGKRFEFFSPAKNAGYGKQYVQEVDSTGAIVHEFKITLGPNGPIETKWIHGGP